MRNLSLIFGLLILITPLYLEAGLFGPENYDECILDKMKGQPNRMRATAIRYCKNKFHVEQLLYKYFPPSNTSANCEDFERKYTSSDAVSTAGLCKLAKHEETFGTPFYESLDFTWGNKGREIIFKINNNPSKYIITKIKATASKTTCEAIEGFGEFNITFDFTGRNFLGFSKHSSSSTAQRKGDDEYRCMYIREIYGWQDE